MKTPKDELIKARISAAMKRQIAEVAEQRGESEAVILREAISHYLAARAAEEPPIYRTGELSLQSDVQKARAAIACTERGSGKVEGNQ